MECILASSLSGLQSTAAALLLCSNPLLLNLPWSGMGVAVSRPRRFAGANFLLLILMPGLIGTRAIACSLRRMRKRPRS
jgi:hypothetical protein